MAGWRHVCAGDRVSATKLVGWVVVNDSEQPMGDGRGAITVFANYDDAAKVDGHVRPAVQPRAERAATTGRGRPRKQTSQEAEE